MELPKRKPNRLRNYDYSRPGMYFVTVCTCGKEKTLGEVVGDGSPVPKLSAAGRLTEQAMGGITQRFPAVQVDNYVIMPNHLHMILLFERPSGTGDPSPTLGEVMGWFKYQVTKAVNQSRNTPGAKVFQRSYYDHVIRNEADYLRVWQYIVENPRKWADDEYYI